MKKNCILGFVCLVLIFMNYSPLCAQSLEDILKSGTAEKIMNTVKETTKLKNIEGTWQYEGAACQFKSDDLLQKAGGIVMAEGMKTKLESAYAKAGIEPGKLSYTFLSDSTFTSQLGQKSFKGTYSYNASTGILTLNYYSLVRMDATVVKTVKGMNLLFNADRLLKLVTLLSSISKSSSLAAVGKVAGQYEGMMLGFELKQ
ncbi:DUF4923 family protein [uncultured Odoribacter sp.]|uniref:DUF4923 family protein n=1 Tax=uncultured Odoribacter sp. TaxID=876416 RepID=UPI00263885B2|nr:DUF4923 family protein [uncultured Odoribacter sp.]